MTWSTSTFKRTVDLTVSLACAPIVALVLLALRPFVRRDTHGSLLYRQTRIGQDRAPFTVLKIRTMRPLYGTNVTVAGDPRITRLGRQLRATKIDELPQIWNVIMGDMSLVGPRPDVPGFLDHLAEGDPLVRVRPGITGLASVTFRHEEALLAQTDNAEAVNQRLLWPAKCDMNRAYIRHASALCDARILLASLLGTRLLRRCCAEIAASAHAKVEGALPVSE